VLESSLVFSLGTPKSAASSATSGCILSRLAGASMCRGTPSSRYELTASLPHLLRFMATSPSTQSVKECASLIASDNQ
jgi:hypothetical protein